VARKSEVVSQLDDGDEMLRAMLLRTQWTATRKVRRQN
jgi:hypothetical protein